MARAWDTDHNYMITLSLPSGGPDVNGDWSNSSGIWIRDFATDYAKIYVDWVASTSVPATDSVHDAHYEVSLRDPGQPSEVTGPTAPRAAGEGVDTVLASITYTLPANVEILRLTGSDNIDGFGNELNNSLVGNSGNNLLDGAGGDNLLWGGAGNDWLVVRSSGDHIFENPGEGFDTVLTAMTSYTLPDDVEGLSLLGEASSLGIGNALANLIQGGNGGDQLYGMQGDDEIHGGSGDDVLVGGADNDALVGGTGLDILLGGAGDDVLDGRGGLDTLQGGDGDDLYLVSSAGDSIVELAAEGNDQILSSVSFKLSAGQEVETLSTADQAGVAAIDLTGNALAQVVFGNEGANTLIGGGGNDYLIGLGGDDILVGNVDAASTLQGGTGDDSSMSSGPATAWSSLAARAMTGS